jgi:hypothetical protein
LWCKLTVHNVGLGRRHEPIVARRVAVLLTVRVLGVECLNLRARNLGQTPQLRNNTRTRHDSNSRPESNTQPSTTDARTFRLARIFQGVALLVFSASGFHRILATKPVRSETNQPVRLSVDNRGSIWDSWPTAFNRCPKGRLCYKSSRVPCAKTVPESNVFN